MKRNAKKLSLRSEAVRPLEAQALQQVVGGYNTQFCNIQYTGACYTNACYTGVCAPRQSQVTCQIVGCPSDTNMCP
jgi:hypothetical protein